MDCEVRTILSTKRSLKETINKLKKEIHDSHFEREDKKTKIVNDLKRVFPCHEVYIFGSQLTGIALKNSDLDVYIDYNKESYSSYLSHETQGKILKTFIEQLYESEECELQSCVSMLNARTPILKFVHTNTNVTCDVICKSGLAVETTILTRQLIQSDFRVTWLVITIRWWMNANKLLNPQIFTTFNTTWLVYFFLMNTKPRILVPLLNMKQGCSQNKIGNWNCGFDKNFYPTKHKQLLNKDKRLKLLVDFFDFYKNFNFSDFVLCPFTGTSIPREHFENVNRLPSELRDYVIEVSAGRADRLPTDTPMCIQNPLELSHNITQVPKMQHVRKFQTYCKQSADICHSWNTPIMATYDL